MFKILLSILFSIPIFLFGQSKLEILKSGFNEKKIFNNVYKLKRQGKIRSERKGIYKLV